MIEHVTMGFVATAIAAAVIVFLLSAFAPTNSTHWFWLAIKKLRNILDLVCYWFFNLCAIGTILYMIGAALCRLLNKGKEIEVNTATIVICAVIAAVVLCVIGGMIRNVKHGKHWRKNCASLLKQLADGKDVQVIPISKYFKVWQMPLI